MKRKYFSCETATLSQVFVSYLLITFMLLFQTFLKLLSLVLWKNQFWNVIVNEVLGKMSFSGTVSVTIAQTVRSNKRNDSHIPDIFDSE